MKRFLILFLIYFTIAGCGCAQNNPGEVCFECPAVSSGGVIVHHQGYSFEYSERHEQALWVAYELTAAETRAVVGRSNHFMPDPSVKTGSATNMDYKGSGYDRGHLAPAADMEWSEATMEESFYFSNMSPQVHGFNGGIWKKLEEKVRDWAVEYGRIYVVTAGVLSDSLNEIGPHHVDVPAYYYKVVLDYQGNGHHNKAIAFLMPNRSSSNNLSDFAVSINDVERVTGIDFFPLLPNADEEKLESRYDTHEWDWGSDAVRDDHHTAPHHEGTVRCSGTTQSGNRCKRMTSSPDGRCRDHH